MANGASAYNCLVCSGQNSERLCRMISAHCPLIFHNVVICQDCGHVQLDPLFDEGTYAGINESFFNRKYLVEDKLSSNNEKKLKNLDRMLSDHIDTGMRILDVGAGEGWAFDYFKGKGCEYSAIEPIPRLAESLSSRGAKIIGASIFEEQAEHRGNYDLVIFRHALEHMLNPGEALNRLAGYLKEGGLLYLVVPNGAKPGMKKGLRTSWLRPVHISYFSGSNLLRLTARAGMEKVAMEEEGEIRCLLSKTDGEVAAEYSNCYEELKVVYRTLLRKTLFKDYSKLPVFLLAKFVK
ncbi:hypothetical protein BVX97_01005 [bacterium E08(2017)]|nr:hypothetical protein BVX97_01005 [bacterium E08(2017)]